MKYIKKNIIKALKNKEIDVIIHGCNCFNTMGAGIAKQLAKEYPIVKETDAQTTKGDEFKLGTYMKVKVPDGIVINAYTQYKYGVGQVHVLKNAITRIVNQIIADDDLKDLRIGIPQIGSGLGGGDWEDMAELFEPIPNLTVYYIQGKPPKVKTKPKEETPPKKKIKTEITDEEKQAIIDEQAKQNVLARKRYEEKIANRYSSKKALLDSIDFFPAINEYGFRLPERKFVEHINPKQSLSSKLKSTIVLSDEQESAQKKFFEWFDNFDKATTEKRFFFISGFAGTGKTTLLSFILDGLGDRKKKATLTCYTGKAATVVMKKTGIHCSTIHSSIYKVKDEKKGIVNFELWFSENPLRKMDLMIIDEVSMVDEELWNDILKFNIPVLVFGDLGQLPPVSGKQVFNETNVDAQLITIHRQALENPIIKLSADVRAGIPIPYGNHGNKVIKLRTHEFDEKQLPNFDQVICGRNVTRIALNKKIREQKGFWRPLPMVGDKIICLRNNRHLSCCNGQIFDVTSNIVNFDENTGLVNFVYKDELTEYQTNMFSEEFFGEPPAKDRKWFLKQEKDINIMDFGWCITAHKSQGSEFKSVCIYDESFVFREHKDKWLYTAITRASDMVCIVG